MTNYLITINQFEHDCVICLFAVSHVYLIGLTKLVAREDLVLCGQLLLQRLSSFLSEDLCHSFKVWKVCNLTGNTTHPLVCPLGDGQITNLLAAFCLPQLILKNLLAAGKTTHPLVYPLQDSCITELKSSIFLPWNFLPTRMSNRTFILKQFHPETDN